MTLCGIDEAGRGALAGPMVVTGVVLLASVEGIDDSKRLTPSKREKLFSTILENAKIHNVIFSNEEIDTLGLSRCLNLALKEIKTALPAQSYLFDGNCNFGVEGVEVEVKADRKVAEVMCASIVAKVSRDRIMCEYEKLYPSYKFCKHKGYGTKLHQEAIEKFGLSPIHRKSFRLRRL